MVDIFTAPPLFDDESQQLDYEMRTLELLGLVEETRPGVWQLTEAGRQQIELDPDDSGSTDD